MPSSSQQRMVNKCRQHPMKMQKEINNARVLLEPILHDTEDLDPQQVAQGMKKEVQQMKDQSVFTEIDCNMCQC